MASFARTSRGVARVATMIAWAVAGWAAGPPPVLDEEGRLTDAFIEEVRRCDQAQFRKQYTVRYTEHILDYAPGWEADAAPPRVTEHTGDIKADLVTGDHNVTRMLVHKAGPRPFIGSRSSGAGYQPQVNDPYKWAYRVDDGRALAEMLEEARDGIS